MQSRSTVRSVAVPTEHGGWALTLEPVVLGLLIAFSGAGVALGAAALVAFVTRTPVKLALVDRRRGRRLPRTVAAERVAGLEVIVLTVLVAVAGALAAGRWWWVPGLIAVPLLAVELWYDVRSRSRRLVPEVVGSVAVASTAAMIALAADEEATLAAGLWLVLGARALTSIPHVRGRIAELHGHAPDVASRWIGDGAALAVAAVAIALDRRLAAGAVAVLALIAAQHLAERRPVAKATVVGIQQTVLGLALVLTTALGVLVGG